MPGPLEFANQSLENYMEYQKPLSSKCFGENWMKFGELNKVFCKKGGKSAHLNQNWTTVGLQLVRMTFNV